MSEADDTQATLTGEPSLEPLKTLAAAARAETVFSAPVTAGDYTVISASEGMMGMGFGYGSGSQSAPGQEPQEGGGGGGGGFCHSRPVAAIVIGPEGVSVQPIVDKTKLAITALTALGAMLLVAVKRR